MEAARMGDLGERVVSIVDDDPSLRRSVRNLLRSVGYRIEVFESAEAFLQSANRLNTGCLLLDVRLAGMSGLDLLAYLVATTPRIQVVMLTAHGDEETRQRCLRMGAIAFLTKPFRPEALYEAVKRAVELPLPT
jgi:two-component system, LuxR family, response regulator FixJ